MSTTKRINPRVLGGDIVLGLPFIKTKIDHKFFYSFKFCFLKRLEAVLRFKMNLFRFL